MTKYSLLKKHARKASRKDDKQLRVLFDHTNEHAICMLDETGRILSWNMSAERLMGYTGREVIGKNYSMFFSKDEIRGNIGKKALAFAVRKGGFTADGIRIRKDGSHFWARSFITPVPKGKTREALFVLITHDITKARAVEQKKEEYIGIASHELRNPIQTLSLYSELLGQRLALDTDKQNLQTLRDMQAQTARLITLIDDLLLVSKVDSGEMELNTEPFDLGILIKKMIRDFQNIASMHKIVYKGKAGLSVRADKNRIAQVLINLLTNAVKYSPKSNAIKIGIARAGRKCIVSVQDFGSGISANDRRQIFTRYFRSETASAGNVAGVGLGLYISKEIIKRHRERIWVKSELGKGTTFSFTLPFAK